MRRPRLGCGWGRGWPLRRHARAAARRRPRRYALSPVFRLRGRPGRLAEASYRGSARITVGCASHAAQIRCRRPVEAETFRQPQPFQSRVCECSFAACHCPHRDVTPPAARSIPPSVLYHGPAARRTDHPPSSMKLLSKRRRGVQVAGGPGMAMGLVRGEVADHRAPGCCPPAVWTCGRLTRKYGSNHGSFSQERLVMRSTTVAIASKP